MRRNKQAKHNYKLRQSLTREAARLMYEEDIKQYYDAKRKAAKRVLGQGQRGAVQIRTKDLPSNGEIAEELAKLAQLHEGDSLSYQLFEMRVLSLEIMNELQEFTPRLIGSVSTGRIRKNSDIDVHVFVDELERLDNKLSELNWPHEYHSVTIRKGNKLVEYTHVFIDKHYPVELSIYPTQELRVRGRSSTDGKPIIRLNPDTVLQLLLEEHSEEWSDYLKSQ